MFLFGVLYFLLYLHNKSLNCVRQHQRGTLMLPGYLKVKIKFRVTERKLLDSINPLTNAELCSFYPVYGFHIYIDI